MTRTRFAAPSGRVRAWRRRLHDGDGARDSADDARVWTGDRPAPPPGDVVLFDSSHGDGETQLRRGAFKAVLAGGVSAANLSAFLAQRPDVLDVSGSLESARGVKSIVRVRQFFAALEDRCRAND